MNIIDQQFGFIVEALQPYSSQQARILMATELCLGEATIAKIRDGRNTNPTRQVMSKIYDYLAARSTSVEQGMGVKEMKVLDASHQL